MANERSKFATKLYVSSPHNPSLSLLKLMQKVIYYIKATREANEKPFSVVCIRNRVVIDFRYKPGPYSDPLFRAGLGP